MGKRRSVILSNVLPFELSGVLTGFGFCIFGRTVTEAALPSSPLGAPFQEVTLTFDLLVRVRSARFLCFEVTSTSPPFDITAFKNMW